MLDTGTVATETERGLRPLVLAPLRWPSTKEGSALGIMSQTVGASTVLEASGCVVESPQEIDRFMLDSAPSLPVALGAMARLGTHFGADVSFRCEMLADPEGDAEPVFVLTARTRLAPSRALRALDEFDNAWWIDTSRSVGGKMQVSVEYL